MLTYEDICSRNRELHEALEALSEKLLSDRPEAEDRQMIRKRMAAIKGEIETNMDRLEVMLTKSSDYIQELPRDKRQIRIKCIETGMVYKSIYEAAVAAGIDGHAMKDMLLGRRKNWTSFVIPGAKKEIKYY